MVKIFREEPLFIKIRKPAKEFPQWIHLKLPQGWYKVNAPLEHRLICKEAQLIPEQDYDTWYENNPYFKVYDDRGLTDYFNKVYDVLGQDTGVRVPEKLREGVRTNENFGAPHNCLYLEATTASSVSTSHDHLYGTTEYEELLKGSTKFAKLTLKRDELSNVGLKVPVDTPVINQGARRWGRIKGKIETPRSLESAGSPLPDNKDYETFFQGQMFLYNAAMFHCERHDSAFAFPLGSSDETSIHLRIADCEGHGLFLLSDDSKEFAYPDDDTVTNIPGEKINVSMFHPDTIVELSASFVYQVFVQDVDMPQHPKEGLLGYYRNAITEPLSNI